MFAASRSERSGDGEEVEEKITSLPLLNRQE